MQFKSKKGCSLKQIIIVSPSIWKIHEGRLKWKNSVKGGWMLHNNHESTRMTKKLWSFGYAKVKMVFATWVYKPETK